MLLFKNKNKNQKLQSKITIQSFQKKTKIYCKIKNQTLNLKTKNQKLKIKNQNLKSGNQTNNHHLNYRPSFFNINIYFKKFFLFFLNKFIFLAPLI